MNIDYTVAALMFPAIALIMGVYSNRFHTLSSLVRKLHDEYVFEKHIPPEWKKQLKNLSRRSVNLKYAIGLWEYIGFSRSEFHPDTFAVAILVIYLRIIKKTSY